MRVQKLSVEFNLVAWHILDEVAKFNFAKHSHNYVHETLVGLYHTDI